MTIALPNDRWKMIHGLPYLGVPEQQIVAMAYAGLSGVPRVQLYTHGVLCAPRDLNETVRVFSPAHFDAAEELLDDYLAKLRKESVLEVFRSEHITVFRREDDGAEAVVSPSAIHNGWSARRMRHGASGATYTEREQAEAASRCMLEEVE